MSYAITTIQSFENLKKVDCEEFLTVKNCFIFNVNIAKCRLYAHFLSCTTKLLIGFANLQLFTMLLQMAKWSDRILFHIGWKKSDLICTFFKTFSKKYQHSNVNQQFLLLQLDVSSIIRALNWMILPFFKVIRNLFR